MTAGAVVRARIDSATKEEATKALEAMGLTVSDAIRIMLSQVASEKQLPFPIKVPNKATREAMNELVSGKTERFENADALLKDLGL
jgi:DNA-damage-inducible protein J